MAVLFAAVALAMLALAFYNVRFVQPQGRNLFPALAAIVVLLAGGLAALWGRDDRNSSCKACGRSRIRSARSRPHTAASTACVIHQPSCCASGSRSPLTG